MTITRETAQAQPHLVDAEMQRLSDPETPMIENGKNTPLHSQADLQLHSAERTAEWSAEEIRSLEERVWQQLQHIRGVHGAFQQAQSTQASAMGELNRLGDEIDRTNAETQRHRMGYEARVNEINTRFDQLRDETHRNIAANDQEQLELVATIRQAEQLIQEIDAIAAERLSRLPQQEVVSQQARDITDPNERIAAAYSEHGLDADGQARPAFDLMNTQESAKRGVHRNTIRTSENTIGRLTRERTSLVELLDTLEEQRAHALSTIGSEWQAYHGKRVEMLLGLREKRMGIEKRLAEANERLEAAASELASVQFAMIAPDEATQKALAFEAGTGGF